MASVSMSSELMAENLFRYLQDLSKRPDCHMFLGIVDRNKHLEQINEEWETANKVNLDNIARLHKQIDGVDSLREDVARLKMRVEDLQGDVSDKTQEVEATERSLAKVNEFRDALEADKASLARKLDDLTKASNQHAQELYQLEAKAFVLSSGVPHQVFSSLDSLLRTAIRLIAGYFGQDMEPELFHPSPAWDKLEERTRRQIPLPLSNSVPAKHMRCAAVLQVLGVALIENVFLQTYLLATSNELNSLMDTLAKSDPEQAEYTRAVLLKSWPSAPESHAKQRAAMVVEQVMALVGPLLPNGKRSQFQLDLSRLCDDICEQWMMLQKAKDRFEASMEPSETGLWRLLPARCYKKTQPRGSTANSSVSNTRANGSNIPNGQTNGNKRQQRQAADYTSSSPSSSSTTPPSESTPFREVTSHSTDVQITLWPVFTHHDQSLDHAAGTTIPDSGLALSKEQIREAQEESHAQETRRRTARQGERDHQKSRKQSIQNGDANVNVNGQDGAPQKQQGKPFLGSGVGGVLGQDG